MHGVDRNEAGKLFVGGLSWDTTKESLLQYFSQYGEVSDCVVMKNQQTGKSRGFGFVTYRDVSCVDTVLSVPCHVVDGRQVDPKACNPKGVNKGNEGGGQRAGRGGHDPFKDKKVFVGGLPGNVDEDFLKNFFSRYGKVVDVTVMYDPQKQRSRGFGFLTFETEESVAKVCSEHFIDLNGKQVECKRAEPRDGRGGNRDNRNEQPNHMPHFDHGNAPPGGPDGNWPPSDGNWNQNAQPPPHMNPPPSFPGGVPFQGGFQEPGYQPGWQQQQQGPPPQGAWPPNSGAPPQQPPPASATFVGQSPVTQAYSSPPGQPPALAPGYQWATSPPQHGQPPAGQSPQTASVPGAPAGYQGYTPPVGQPQTPGNAPPPRMYGDFTNGQQPINTGPAPAPAPALGSTPQPYTAGYTSPYGAPPPQGAGTAPPEAYGQPPTTPQAAAPIQAPPGPAPTQPGAVASYGSPVQPAPVAPPADPSAAQPKPPEYNYYGNYSNVGQYPSESGSFAPSQSFSAGASATPVAPGAPGSFPQGGASFGSQTSTPVAPQAPNTGTGYGGDASAAAYGAAPPAQPPFGGQGDAQPTAYAGAPGPAPSFQRQSSGAQAYHPYRR